MALPVEGAGWRSPFWGPWFAAATSLKSFDHIACTPNPAAVAVGIFYGALHYMVAIAKPVPWAPSLGEGRPGVPHGGRKGGRNRAAPKPVAKFRVVYNLPAESQFAIEGGLQMALFDVASLALEVGYIIFLADIFRDSLLIGTSAAYRYAGCIPSQVGPAQGHFNDSYGPTTTRARALIQTDYDPSHLIAVNRFTVPAGYSMTCTYSMPVIPYVLAPNNVGSISTSIFDETGNAIVGGCGAAGTSPGEGLGYKIGNRFTLPVSTIARTYSILVTCRDGYATIDGGSFMITDALNTYSPLLFDP